MYQIDRHDSVTRLLDVPQSSFGAPLPLVLATETQLSIAYFVETPVPGWDGTWVQVASYDRGDEPAAIVTFKGVKAALFGPPNDEAFAGHPLAARGLTASAAFEVEHSSWIRAITRMNEVHPLHHPSRFEGLHHFVLSFHDSTFEVIARTYAVSVARAPLFALLPRMVSLLDEESGAA
jgi:hypothetical protein